MHQYNLTHHYMVFVGLALCVACGDPPLDATDPAEDAQRQRATDAQSALADSSQTEDGTGGHTSDVAATTDDALDSAGTKLVDGAGVAGQDAGTSGGDTAGAAEVTGQDSGGPASGFADSGGYSGGDSVQDVAADTSSGSIDAVGNDVTSTVACGVCPFDKRPTGDHPAAEQKQSVLEPKDINYIGGFGNGDKTMRVWVPLAAGKKPVLFFVHDRHMHTNGPLLGTEPGQAYKELMMHVAQRGYIAAFVRVQANAGDCDFKAMAQRLVDASAVLLDKVSKAAADKVVFAGHGMGAKVALLAARRTINQDPKNEWPDPTALLLFNLDNSKPSLCLSSFEDAAEAAGQLLASEQVRITFAHTEDDQASPYKKKNGGALQVYDQLKIKWRQFIVLHGTGKDDPNAATQPELRDDHSAPLTVEGKPSGLANLGAPESRLDALDWYGYWKLLIGAMDFHFKGGSPAWAYGALRVHGGVASGKVIKHEVLKQGW